MDPMPAPASPSSAAAGALYDSRRGVWYVKPALCLVIMWTLTVTAATIRLAWMSAPELAAGSTFVGLGWVAVLALPGVWTRAGVAAGLLMLAGGLLYTAGALCYHRRRPDPYPAVFGYHEVFHAYVCAAAACQYVAIALFLTSRG